MSAPAKVFLHIGLHKTGTTFLQNLFRANTAGLAAQGVYFPWGDDEPSQTHAVWDLQGRRPRGAKDPRIAGQWQFLVDRINSSEHPTALVSEERISISPLKQARAAVEPFKESEVHVIVTARDLARIAVSSWQEDVKNDRNDTWQEYFDAMRDPEAAVRNPARGFWMREDLLRILQTWEAVVAADRMHVVTVPPSGSDPGLLTERFASVVGFDPALLTEEPHWNNETVGVAGIEVVRRLNQRLGGRLNQPQYDMLVKRTIVQMLATRTETVRFGIPADDMDWVMAKSQEWIDTIGARGYHVVGDLEDLRPRPPRTAVRRPDEVSESELLEASLDALAMLSEDWAEKWWVRRNRRLTKIEERQNLSSRTRAAVYKSQSKAADLADRNAYAARLMGVVLKGRERAVERANKRREPDPQ